MAVSVKVAKVLRSVSELNGEEREAFIAKVNDLLSNDSTRSSLIKEEFKKSLDVTFGPAPNTCPCCGR